MYEFLCTILHETCVFTIGLRRSLKKMLRDRTINFGIFMPKNGFGNTKEYLEEVWAAYNEELIAQGEETGYL